MANYSKNPNARYIVYFALSVCGRYIKIGSTCRLKGRMTEYANQGHLMGGAWDVNPFGVDMKVIGFIPGDRDKEKALQARFKAYNAGFKRRPHHAPPCEWFVPNVGLIEFITTETIPFIGYDVDGMPLLPGGITPEMAFYTNPANVDKVKWSGSYTEKWRRETE